MMADFLSSGFGKGLLYCRIALHVALAYALRMRKLGWSLRDYFVFLRRAAILLLSFRHNKAVRVATGYKLDIYVPAYPSEAFFRVVDSKLVTRPAAPTTVVFSMTKACRYKCGHCYQRMDGGADLDESSLLTAAKDMLECGVAYFNVEGGEPMLLFDRLERLLQVIDRRGEVWVNTTGDSLSPDKMARLKALNVLGVMVSIHASTPEAHDAFTGVPGSFEKARQALRAFKAAGFATAINSVLSEKDVLAGGIDSLMEVAKSLSCDYVQLIHPKPAGAWLGKHSGMQMTSELVAKIQERHLHYNLAVAKSYPGLAAQVFEESELALGCTSGGVDRFYLNAHGEVQPCEFLNVSFGNVKDEPFAAILARMRSHFKTPGCDWLCCTQADSINEAIGRSEGRQTPLPRCETEKLVDTWKRGKPTPLYKRLGIYK